MSSPVDSPARRVAWARARLGLLVLAVAVLFAVLTATGQVDVSGLRTWIASAGPAGVLAWVAAAAVLGAVLVPGPVLATSSGLLFGPWVGAAVNVAATLGTTVLSLLAGRALGHDGVRSFLSHRRITRLEALRDSYGVTVVFLQRIVPGLPDTVSNYVFGALGFRLRHAVLGTLLGSTPWALAYALLGSSLEDPFSVRGAVTVAAFALAATAGLVAAARGRRLLATLADPGAPAPAEDSTPE